MVTPDQAFTLQREAQQMGKLGIWFGTKENAALYMAAALMIAAMIVLSILMIAEPSLRNDIAKVFAAVIVGALGFIGGLLSGSK